jgi:hypothetical protein
MQPLTRRRTFLALTLLTLFPLLVGCGRAINRTAERRIRDALPNILGPARQYRVHVENSPTRTIEGRLSNVTVDGDDVQLSNGLLLDQLHLDLQDMEVDTHSHQVRKIGSARFVATIGEAGLDEFLAGESPQGDTIRKTRVSLGDRNIVTIASERVTLGVGIPFQITGPLRVAGPRRNEIDAARMVVVGIPISGMPLRFLKQRFESGLDLSQLPFPVQITSVQTTRGRLMLAGTADVTALLRNAQADGK